MNARRLVLFAVLPLLAPAADAAFNPAAFRLLKAIDGGAGTQEEVLAVELDAEVYAASRAGHPDLRVLGPGNQELPFQLEKVTVKRYVPQRRPHSGTVHDLQELPDNRLQLVVDRQDQTPPVAGITLRNTLTDFERRVSVAGSQDGQTWTPLVSEALIYDYSRFMAVRNADISLPTNDFKQFRLIIEQVTDEAASPLRELARQFQGGQETATAEWRAVLRRPLHLDAVELWGLDDREEIVETRLTDYPTVGQPEAREEAKTRETIVEVRTCREPLTALVLATPSRNFRREVVVEAEVARPQGPEWIRLATGSISLVAFRDFRESHLEISFPETRSGRYRLKIANGDNPPLPITAVTGRGPVYRLLFLTPDGRHDQLRLLYGSDRAETPSYDLGSVLAVLGRGYAPLLAKLGAQTLNPVADPSAIRGPSRFLSSPWFLGTAVALMVLVLGGLLFRVGGRLDHLPKETD